MAKKKGSRKVVCKRKHENYLLPGDKRVCSAKNCRQVVSLPKVKKK